MYTVKEIFYTLQGEGYWAGRPAVFCRFSGCNLWSGREKDRASALCKFCDTEFVGGKKYKTPDELADAVQAAWGPEVRHRFVVLTGGEPMLQFDAPLRRALFDRRFMVAVETNGSVAVTTQVDWLCVSPKAGVTLQVVTADEIKVVFPQPGLDLEAVARIRAKHYYLQPMASPASGLVEAHTREAIEYVMRHPKWRLSLQTHKLAGFA